MKKKIKQLEQRIGCRFRKRKLLIQACVHRSHRFENDEIDRDNERLEFLGDAVLGCLAAEHLFTAHPEMSEGEMTQIRSAATNMETLAAIARSINLGEFLLLGKGEARSQGAERPSNLADAMEAVIGAAYLDGGMKSVRRIFQKCFIPILDTDTAHLGRANPKGALQEYGQSRWKISPAYTVLSAEGPPHSKVYRVEVRLGKHLCAEGTGLNKKDAEKDAAAKALEALAQE